MKWGYELTSWTFVAASGSESQRNFRETISLCLYEEEGSLRIGDRQCRQAENLNVT